MSAQSTSGLSVIKSYCYELSTLNKVYFTLPSSALSNEPLSDERDESRLLMPAGMFFLVIGG